MARAAGGRRCTTPTRPVLAEPRRAGGGERSTERVLARQIVRKLRTDAESVPASTLSAVLSTINHYGYLGDGLGAPARASARDNAQVAEKALLPASTPDNESLAEIVQRVQAWSQLPPHELVDAPFLCPSSVPAVISEPVVTPLAQREGSRPSGCAAAYHESRVVDAPRFAGFADLGSFSQVDEQSCHGQSSCAPDLLCRSFPSVIHGDTEICLGPCQHATPSTIACGGAGRRGSICSAHGDHAHNLSMSGPGNVRMETPIWSVAASSQPTPVGIPSVIGQDSPKTEIVSMQGSLSRSNLSPDKLFSTLASKPRVPYKSACASSRLQIEPPPSPSSSWKASPRAYNRFSTDTSNIDSQHTTSNPLNHVPRQAAVRAMTPSQRISRPCLPLSERTATKCAQLAQHPANDFSPPNLLAANCWRRNNFAAPSSSATSSSAARLEAARRARWCETYSGESASATDEAEAQDNSRLVPERRSLVRLSGNQAGALPIFSNGGQESCHDGQNIGAISSAVASADAEAICRSVAKDAAAAIAMKAAPTRLRLFIENEALVKSDFMRCAQLAVGNEALVRLAQRSRGSASIELTAAAEDAAERAILAVVALVCSRSAAVAVLIRWYLHKPALAPEALLARWQDASTAVLRSMPLSHLAVSLREKRDALHIVLQTNGAEERLNWRAATLPRVLGLLLTTVRYGAAGVTTIPVHRSTAVRILGSESRGALRALEQQTCALALLIRQPTQWEPSGLPLEADRERKASEPGWHSNADEVPNLRDEVAVLFLIGPRRARDSAGALVDSWLKSLEPR